MADIIILGSASGDPSPERANSSFLLRTGGKLYQFDAGEGCSAALKRQKIDHSKISGVFISHTHPDHITGIFLEIQMMYLAGRKEPLPIYLPAEAKEAVEQFMQATYLFEEKMGFEIPIRAIEPDPIFRDENVTIYARSNSHLDNYRRFIENGKYPNKLQSYSFVVITENKKMIYSGDIGSSDDYSDLLDECDLLITEGMHLDLEKLFADVATNNVKQLVLTHLTDKIYREPDKIVQLAGKFGISNLSLASDAMALKI